MITKDFFYGPEAERVNANRHFVSKIEATPATDYQPASVIVTVSSFADGIPNPVRVQPYDFTEQLAAKVGLGISVADVEALLEADPNFPIAPDQP